MEKALRKEIENKLCNYFIKDKVICNLKKEITLLEKHIEDIRNEIESNRKSIDNLDECKIYTSNYQEQTILNIIAKKEEEIVSKISKISDIQETIRKMETDCEKVRYSLEKLELDNKEHMELLKLKYGIPRHNEQQIAFKLHCSQSTVNRMKDSLLKHISLEQ